MIRFKSFLRQCNNRSIKHMLQNLLKIIKKSYIWCKFIYKEISGIIKNTLQSLKVAACIKAETGVGPSHGIS